jgi:peptidoglycan/xylan/chitin deacetylase (PgdA/CDA1 family)
MKVVLSHDVDHLKLREHLLKDLIVQKFYVRATIEFAKGMISFGELMNRIADLFHNKWNGVDELISLHNSLNIKSVFYVGVANGRGLSYKHEDAAHWIKHIHSNNFEVGVHGISYETFEGMKMEYDRFKNYLGNDNFGIRMHYLKMTENTLSFMKECGYKYDCTLSELKDPYYKDGILEFPLQLMDGWVIDGNKRWQTRKLEQSKDYTKSELDKADKANLKYLSILFHDRYYSNSFITWKNWYDWLLQYLIDNKFEFTDYKTIVESNSFNQTV